ncbi:MAG: hypothetical protein WC565_07435 [Parcubacteria group bacterium]|jgi:hypothetical protein
MTKTKKTKKTATKAVKKTAPRPVALDVETLRKRAAHLKWALEDVETYRERLLAGMHAVWAAAHACTSAISHVEAAKARCLALLSVSIDGIERSQRIELEPGETRDIDLFAERGGLADIQLQNLGRNLCFMTEAISLGLVFSKGSFIRASVEVVAGQVIKVKVSRL